MNTTHRARPGAGGTGDFYHIELHPKTEYVTFRTQDVGERGGLERLAGQKPDGSWETAAWLVAKSCAQVNAQGHLVITDEKAQSILNQITEPIVQVKGDIFRSHVR